MVAVLLFSVTIHIFHKIENYVIFWTATEKYLTHLTKNLSIFTLKNSYQAPIFYSKYEMEPRSENPGSGNNYSRIRIQE